MFRRCLPVLSAAAATFALLVGSASAAGAQHADLTEAASFVEGAQADLADAQAYLAELRRGEFAGIFAIGDDGSMRCGEVAANPACSPLTEADKAAAIAEAEEMVAHTVAQLQDAEVQFAAMKTGHSAEMAAAE